LRAASSVYAIAFALICMVQLSAGALSHPLPNSVVALTLDKRRVSMRIEVPVAEVETAMAAGPDGVGGAPSKAQVGGYFARHVAILDASGAAMPQTIRSVEKVMATDPEVGKYQEWHITIEANTPSGHSRSFILRYDAIIHQIPTHFAAVTIERDFSAGLIESETPMQAGVIKFDFASAKIEPLVIIAGQGSLRTGFRAMAALGYFHVLHGIDHILFLLTLLAVAPLAMRNGRWMPVHCYGHALRRFLAISLAFTAGHSISLAAGAFEVVRFNGMFVEVSVAVSIVLAAIHAIRPLFFGREWMVAAAFGLVHGLAFSQSLAGIGFGWQDKSVAVLGFNLGVEAAQITVMAAALPLLALSRANRFQPMRQAAMVLVAMVACHWIGERAFGLPLPQWLLV
jgi:HupE / UreJ protein